MKRVVLESIEGVEIYPIISLVIFTAMFAIAIVYVFRMDVKLVEELSNLPLSDKNSFNQKRINNEKE